MYRLAVVILLSPFLQDMSPEQLGQKLAKNYEELRNYTWTMRAQVTHDGQQSTGLFKMRYDLDGNLQRTPLDGQDLAQTLPEDVKALARAGLSYAQPRPKIFTTFMRSAEVWSGKGPQTGTMKIEGTGMLVADDEVEISTKGGRATRMRVDGTFRGQAVTIRTDYRGLPNGPTYVARLRVSQISTGTEIQVENFDHIYNAPTPVAPPKPTTATFPADTEVLVRLVQPLSTKKTKTGESFEAILDAPLAAGGKAVIPRGTRVVGQVVEAKGSGRIKGRAKLSLTIKALHVGGDIPVQTHVIAMEAEGSKGRDARRIGGSTGMGALIGAIAGGGSGAAKGAAIGAGVGAGITLATKGKEIELAAEQLLSFKLSAPLTVQIAPK